MIELFGGLAQGFGVVFTLSNLAAVFIGCLVGTLIGALPGLGTSGTIAILLPITIGMAPATAMIMFAGIYTGAMYGGSITSILINTPGESSSVMTTLDGYQLAKLGRGGAALGMCAIASFVSGTIGVLLMTFIAPSLADFALSFGPTEYFSLMLLGLTMLAFLGSASFLKALASGLVGLLLALVGMDPVEGQKRFTFGMLPLMDGIAFMIAAMGLFAIAEILMNVERSKENRPIFSTSWKSVYPTMYDIVSTRWTMLRAAVIGFLIGALPGAGATIASFVSYGVEKRLSRHPEEFGKGAMAGVVAPEGANNAASAGALVPLLTLGIPGSGATAMMLGALILYGVKPGPLLIQNEPELFWGVIASLYISNMVLLVMNLPLIPAFAAVLKVPYHYLYPFIFIVTMIGVYSLNNIMFDLQLLVAFAVLGYAMRKLGFPAAPVVLALVLGPLIERALNQALTISHGDFSVFFTHPISATLIALNILLVVGAVRRGVGSSRRSEAQGTPSADGGTPA